MNQPSNESQPSPTTSTRNTRSPQPSAPPMNQRTKNDDPPSYNDVMDGLYGNK